MVIRFKWWMYSVVIGFLRKGDPVAGVLKGNESGASGNIDMLKKGRKRVKASRFLKGRIIGMPGGKVPGGCKSGNPGEWGCRIPEECGCGYPGECRCTGPAAGEWERPAMVRGREGRNPKGEEDSRWRDDQLFHLAQTVITELKPRIWAAGIQKQDKQDLLLSLLRLLKSYTSLTVLRAYPFRIAINNFIEKETATRCSIHLNNEELLALWREVR
jgi:hypothetical protein